MTTSSLSKGIISKRLCAVDQFLTHIEALPLRERARFFADSRNSASAESWLRRALESLCTVGRHILAQGYGFVVPEYKQLEEELAARGILSDSEASLLSTLADYNHRLVHFYHEVSNEELYDICANRLCDVRLIADSYRRWLRAHPERMDETL